MLASTTPFKIFSSNNDENTNTSMTTTKGKGGGLGKSGGGLSVFHDVTTTTKHGSTIKSTRKALVDVTNSTMHAPRTVGKLVGDHQHQHHGPTKPSTVQFKIQENQEKISDHTKPAAVIITSSTTEVASSSSIHADMVRQPCFSRPQCHSLILFLSIHLCIDMIHSKTFMTLGRRYAMFWCVTR